MSGALLTAARRQAIAQAAIVWLVVVMALTAARLAGAGGWLPQGRIDFDNFYAAGRAVWAGGAVALYHLDPNQPAGSAFNWSYPPPFDLLVAGLALLPLWLAYVLFIGGSFAGFAAALRRLAPGQWLAALVLVWVPMFAVVTIGQNGFLTAMLVALTGIGLMRGRSWAGVPLGLLVIKPHLAIALTVYVVARGRWATVAVAALTVLAACGIATACLGLAIWPAFAASWQEAAGLLESGGFRVFRMLSPFAMLWSLGVGYGAATAAHAAIAVAALGMVAVAARRFALAPGFGLACIAAVFVPPYAYDYDLPIAAVGIALLLPVLRGHATTAERRGFYAAALFAGAYGAAATLWLIPALGTDAVVTRDGSPPALAALGIAAMLAIAWRVIRRATTSGCAVA